MRVRHGFRLYGLYEGVPITRRVNYSMVLPDKITIFRQTLENDCYTKDEIKDQVVKTVLHEIGHHFGLSDEELNNV